MFLLFDLPISYNYRNRNNFISTDTVKQSHRKYNEEKLKSDELYTMI